MEILLLPFQACCCNYHVALYIMKLYEESCYLLWKWRLFLKKELQCILSTSFFFYDVTVLIKLTSLTLPSDWMLKTWMDWPEWSLIHYMMLLFDKALFVLCSAWICWQSWEIVIGSLTEIKNKVKNTDAQYLTLSHALVTSLVIFCFVLLCLIDRHTHTTCSQTGYQKCTEAQLTTHSHVHRQHIYTHWVCGFVSVFSVLTLLLYIFT